MAALATSSGCATGELAERIWLTPRDYRRAAVPALPRQCEHADARL
jgi:hypothetical protein